jgi:ketosteroid isomerase-like protein
VTGALIAAAGSTVLGAAAVTGWHALAGALLRLTYRRVNAGDLRFLARMLSVRVRYEFHGQDHPLAGVYRGRAEVVAFIARLHEAFPGSGFEVGDVAVRGWPWRVVAITWLAENLPLPGREPMRTRLAQRTVIRWGRVTELATVADTMNVQRAFGAVQPPGG